MDEIIEKPYREVLTYIAYNTSKNKMLKAMHDEEQRKYKYK
jgi:hypothetical protein